MTAILVALALLPAPADPAAEARAMLDAQQTAWNVGKLEEFVGHYAPDASFYSGGSVTKGRDEVLARYRKNYQADGKEMGKLTFSEVEVEPITATNAIVRGRWLVATKAGTTSGLFTLVCKKSEGWRITHDHTSKGE